MHRKFGAVRRVWCNDEQPTDGQRLPLQPRRKPNYGADLLSQSEHHSEFWA